MVCPEALNLNLTGLASRRIHIDAACLSETVSRHHGQLLGGGVHGDLAVDGPPHV